jgi:hypothetical protein
LKSEIFCFCYELAQVGITPLQLYCMIFLQLDGEKAKGSITPNVPKIIKCMCFAIMWHQIQAPTTQVAQHITERA